MRTTYSHRRRTRCSTAMRSLWESLERRQLLSTVSGTLFVDADVDQVRDTGERVLPGWFVFADVNANGKLDNAEPTSLTSPLGAYTLNGLPAGNYAITAV